MRIFFLLTCLLGMPASCWAAVGILLEGPGSLAPETQYVDNPGRFDVQGDGIPEVVYAPDSHTLRAVNKSGNEIWIFTLDPALVCPTCDPSPQYWQTWFQEFIDTEPGQRDALVSISYFDGTGGEFLSAAGLVAAATGELRQLITGRYVEGSLDLDNDGLWELLLAQDGPPEGHWEVWGYGSTTSAGGLPAAAPGIRLMQNHPNPFSPTTTVQFELSRSAPVRIEFFSVTGRLVDTMDLGLLSPGSHRCQWTARETSGRPLPTGNYYYSVVAGGERQSRKMLLLK